MVRLARTEAHIGPVAAGFWRMGLAAPFLILLAWRQDAGRPLPRWPLIAAIAVGGLFFAADLAAWHAGILRTRLANATLFGNFPVVARSKLELRWFTYNFCYHIFIFRCTDRHIIGSHIWHFLLKSQSFCLNGA